MCANYLRGGNIPRQLTAPEPGFEVKMSQLQSAVVKYKKRRGRGETFLEVLVTSSKENLQKNMISHF